MSKLHLKPKLNIEDITIPEWDIYHEGVEEPIGSITETSEEGKTTYEFSYLLGTTQYVSDGWGTLDSCTNNFLINFKHVLKAYLELMK